MAAEVARLVGDGAPTGGDFEALERACRDAALGVMGRMVAKRLNADRGDTCASAACRCGGEAVHVDRREKTFTTALGSMTLERAWYHCPACGHGFSARDRALGVENTSWSPAVRRMVGITAAETSFGHASAVLRELAGVEVGAKQVERGPSHRSLFRFMMRAIRHARPPRRDPGSSARACADTHG